MQSIGHAPVARDVRLWALSLGNFAIGTGVMVVSGLLPPMSADLGLSYAALGQTITAFAVAVALGAPLLAGPTSRLDRRLVLQIALAVFIAGHAICALSSGYETLLLGRVVAGLGAALFTPHASVAASLLTTPQTRGRAMALVFLGFTASTVLGVPIGTVAGDLLGWRATFWAIVSLACLALFAVRLLLPHDLRAPAIDTRSWFTVFSNRTMTTLLLVTVAQSAGQFVLLSYIAPALKAAIGATSFVLGAMFAIYGVLGVIGNIVAGAIIDTRGAAFVMNVMIASVGAGLVLFPLSSLGLTATVAVMALWGFGSFALNSAQQARLVSRSAALASATLPLNSSAIYVGQAIGAGVGALLLTGGGLGFLGPCGAALLVVALGLSIAADRFKA